MDLSPADVTTIVGLLCGMRLEYPAGQQHRPFSIIVRITGGVTWGSNNSSGA
jgi:hypothetical protein